MEYFHSDPSWMLPLDQLPEESGQSPRTCAPVAVFDNFNEQLLERFLLEHTALSLKRSLYLLEHIEEDDGKIKLYEIETCLKKLKK